MAKMDYLDAAKIILDNISSDNEPEVAIAAALISIAESLAKLVEYMEPTYLQTFVDGNDFTTPIVKDGK